MPNPEQHTQARRRRLFGDRALSGLTGLEIGPLDDPIVRRTDGAVTYVDHLTTEGLRAKYADDPAVDKDRIVEVDAVWGERPLAEQVGAGIADYVVASQVAEHVPDFVGWLAEIERVLKPGGELMLVVPDKRFSYDAARRETNLVDVLDAYARHARVPQAYQLLDCALNIVRADPYQIHVDDVPADSFPPIHTVDSALDLARHVLAQGDYVDVTCWCFTPRSLAGLMVELTQGGLTSLACSVLADTDASANWEFVVKMQAGMGRDAAIESWRVARDGALLHVKGSGAEMKHAGREARAAVPLDLRDLRPAPKLSRRHLARATVVPDRLAMLETLPRRGVVAEIGVALGTFSRALIEACEPSRFIAIDLFRLHELDMLWGRSTEDIFGSDTHAAYYRKQVGAVSGSVDLRIMEGDSVDQLRQLEDRSVDVFYVDADHSFESCAAELAVIKDKVTDDGVICVNDYVMVDYMGDGRPYGVVQATNAFMIDEGWEMVTMALQESMYCDVVIRKSR